MSLKERLINNPRGSNSVPEYLQEMRTITDDLVLIDHPLPKDILWEGDTFKMTKVNRRTKTLQTI